MLDLATHAEELGLEGVYLNDHVLGLFNEAKNPFLEAMTTMAAIGVQTRRIRIGHIVIFNSLRNPAYLAKTLTTLDHLTKGRLDVLIGAGWNPIEYEGYDLLGDGKGMPSAGERVNRLIETVDILRGMFKSNEFTYNGRYNKKYCKTRNRSNRGKLYYFRSRFVILAVFFFQFACKRGNWHA